MSFVAIVVLCRVLGDFYPFNKFPMYANPAEESSEFVVVTNGKDEPIPVKLLTGETSAKVKKKYVAVRNDLAAAAGIKNAANDTPAEVKAEAWERVAEMLRKLAKKRKQSLPDPVVLKIGYLFQEPTKFREEWIVIGSSSVKKD